MAKTLCIKAEAVAKIKEALVNKELSIEDLYNMNSSAERQAEFAKYMPQEIAKFTTLKFEKAAASSNREALTNFIKSLTTAKEAKTKKSKNLLAKIEAIEDAGLLDADSQTATFTDLISDRLGISVDATELEAITEKADKIKMLKQDVMDIEAMSGQLSTKEYFKRLRPAQVAFHGALTEMDKYLNSMSPTHNLKVITGTIFRGNMLLNIPPATINTISNLVQGTMQAAERRIASGQMAGSNAEFALEYFKMTMEVFHKTGYDMSREYAEDIRLGEHIVHSEGPGIIRKTGRGISKVVFKYLLGYSDVVSASAAAADSTNLATAKIARKNGLKGEEAKEYALAVFKESLKQQPDITSPIGQDALIVRQQAIADAEFATWTNKGFIAERSLQFRDWLNDSTGDLQLGFWNIPFVKTGANVIQFGIESSPIGGIVALAKLKTALKTMKDPALSEKEAMAPMQDVMRRAVRSGLGTILSLIMVSLIPPDDFFSAYEISSKKQREILGIKKGVYNAVKIGDKWISLDFFGALGAGFVGMMYGRKYGNGVGDTIFKTAQGVGAQALQVPGLQDFEGLYASMKDILTAETKEEAGLEALGATINSVRARAIPGIVNTIAKGTDEKIRKIDNKELLSRVKAGIPGMRQKLPVKIDITTGKDVKGEGFWTNLLFGSRVKTANESALIDEISRLEKEGQAPAIADIERGSSKVQELKATITAERYHEALKWFGRVYGKMAEREIRGPEYRYADDEKKMSMLNKIRTEVRGEMLKKYKYPRKKKKGLK